MFSGHLIGAEKARRNPRVAWETWKWVPGFSTKFLGLHRMLRLPGSQIPSQVSRELITPGRGLEEAVLSPEALPRTQTPHFPKDMEAGQ